jgi:hypothetical protein
MTLAEIKKKCIAIMKSKYPTSTYKYYSNAVVENFVRPCFFTEITIDQTEPASSDAEHYLGEFSIEVLQDKIDEAKALEIANTLRLAFGRYFMVDVDQGKKRAVKVRQFNFEFAGTDDNIPVITIMFEWFDRGLLPSETADMMTDVDVSLKVEVEE